MRYALFWDITQHIVVIPYGRFGSETGSINDLWLVPCSVLGDLRTIQERTQRHTRQTATSLRSFCG